MRQTTTAFFATLAALTLSLAAGGARADELPRRGIVGVQLAPITPELRESSKLESGATGVATVAVVPGSAAEAAGLQPGDIILSVGDKPVAATIDFTAAIRAYTGGDRVTLHIQRAGEKLDLTLVLKSQPFETEDGLEITYGQVVSNGARLRTVMTRPAKTADAKKLPALLFIQGLSCAPVDNVKLYQNLLFPLSKSGIVTMRVEKPGVGDAEGGPCSEINFEQELDAYRQALKALKKTDFVDADRIFVFGHSMGGVMGPVLAVEEPVLGLAVYGTAVRTWMEYMLENTRRQTALAGASPAEVEQAVRRETLFQNELLIEKRSPKEIRERNADFAAGYFAENMVDDAHIFGRHYTFFQQLYEQRLAEAWAKFDGFALAIWGESDFVTSGIDHQLIADIVNAHNAGRGKYLPLPQTDHAFAKRPSLQAAMQAGMQGGEYNTALTDAVLAWIKEVLAKSAA